MSCGPRRRRNRKDLVMGRESPLYPALGKEGGSGRKGGKTLLKPKACRGRKSEGGLGRRGVDRKGEKKKVKEKPPGRRPRLTKEKPGPGAEVRTAGDADGVRGKRSKKTRAQ